MAAKVAEIMAKELNKDKSWINQQVEDYKALAQGYII
jgi:glycerol-3-phosphate dehydrogenase